MFARPRQNRIPFQPLVLLAIVLSCMLALPAFADEGHNKVAPDSETASAKVLLREGMSPIDARDVVDGVYEIEAESSSPFFKIKSATLTVRDGQMTAQIGLDSKSYPLIYTGTAKQAAAAPASDYIEFDGNSWTFTVPVSALDQEIDRYISMNSDGFKNLISKIGNVNYVVPIRDDGIRPESTSQVLDPSQFETLLTSRKYSSEQERAAVIGLSVAALINQCDGKRIATNLDGYFRAVINNVNTDITTMDFSSHRHAIEYIFEHATAPAKGISLIYDLKGEDLVITDSAITNLKVTFSQVATKD